MKEGSKPVGCMADRIRAVLGGSSEPDRGFLRIGVGAVFESDNCLAFDSLCGPSYCFGGAAICTSGLRAVGVRCDGEPDVERRLVFWDVARAFPRGDCVGVVRKKSVSSEIRTNSQATVEPRIDG